MYISRPVSTGRAIRHRGDYSSIVLCDRRYSRPATLSKLPAWIRDHTSTCKSFGPAYAALRKVRVSRRVPARKHVHTFNEFSCSSFSSLWRRRAIKVKCLSPDVKYSASDETAAKNLFETGRQTENLGAVRMMTEDIRWQRRRKKRTYRGSTDTAHKT